MGKCCDHSSASFVIESSSFSQARRTLIKAWMSSKFEQIPSRTPELSALDRLKIDVNVVNTLAPLFFQIFFIFAGNKNIHNILNEIGQDRTKNFGVSCP